MFEAETDLQSSGVSVTKVWDLCFEHEELLHLSDQQVHQKKYSPTPCYTLCSLHKSYGTWAHFCWSRALSFRKRAFGASKHSRQPMKSCRDCSHQHLILWQLTCSTDHKWFLQLTVLLSFTEHHQQWLDALLRHCGNTLKIHRLRPLTTPEQWRMTAQDGPGEQGHVSHHNDLYTTVTQKFIICTEWHFPFSPFILSFCFPEAAGLHLKSHVGQLVYQISLLKCCELQPV